MSVSDKLCQRTKVAVGRVTRFAPVTMVSRRQGFHTVLNFALTIDYDPPIGCSLHFYQVLPSHVYADPYELRAYHGAFAAALFDGTRDFELPALIDSGSNSTLILMNVSTQAVQARTRHINIDIPLHARYSPPKSQVQSGPLLANVTLPPSDAFWACMEQRTSVLLCIEDY